jgi:hypothetical protein
MPAEPASTELFYEPPSAPRRLLERPLAAGFVAGLGFLIFLLAIQHESTNCKDACFDGGQRTPEPGHAWTAYESSWQWQAQWALGLIALVLGLGAVFASSRYIWRRRAAALVMATTLASAAWILEPAIPE